MDPINDDAANDSVAYQPLLLTMQEAAARLAISLRKLQGEVAAGRLVVVRTGRVVRVHPSDLRDYLDACRCVRPGEMLLPVQVARLPVTEAVGVAPTPRPRRTKMRPGAAGSTPSTGSST